MIRSSCALFLLALGLFAARPAEAETYATCTGFITSIPTVITTQGNWCLKQDLSTAITSGNAVTIATNNVTIDCNNFKIGGLGGGVATTADGIVAVGRQNAIVRDCNIRGFLHGVFFHTGGGGHTIENNRFDGITFVAVAIEGDGSIVRRNRIFDTGGSTGIASAIGIGVLNSVDVINNTISGVVATTGAGGNAIGILTASNTGSSIHHNKIRNLFKDGAGQAIGIYNSSSARLAMRDNDLTGDASNGSIGLSCVDATAFARGNVINGFDTAINNCGTTANGNSIIN